jgi:23S rRNA (cytosine1962-C5)-methyltransferase
MARVLLKPGRDKSLKRRHPWIFDGAIKSVEGEVATGGTVAVISADGHPLGHGAYSPSSQIAVRMWSFDANAEIAPAFLRGRLERALARRGTIEPGGARRLVNAESDGLPGLVVDRYDRFLVCQFRSAGAEAWRNEIVELVREAVPCDGVFERSDNDARAKEGLAPRTGVLAGDEPAALIEINEGPCRFLVDVRGGHKTGFYLDQHDNRAALAEYVRGREVLNGFAYTGAFGVAALQHGAARVTNIETSKPLLEIAERHTELNAIEAARVENLEGDVFQLLRRFRDSRRDFDLIVLDPPKFAESTSQVAAASRGYKDINLLAFKLLRPGGVLFTFSCSAHVKPELFQKIVADAALDAGREAQIVRRLTQAPDHPVALSFPEAGYLKGLVCAVDPRV